jgi:hypothetical protein
MIIEFQNQLKAYSFPESIEDTEGYLEKYWLQEQEYLSKWKEVQTSIFNLDVEFPKMIVNPEFRLLPRQGGLLFEQEEFELLKECIKEAKDKSLFVIEDYNELCPPHESGPLLRFKYPVDLKWSEINIGDGISYELFQRPVRNYFVFGDSGKWGKYVANDFDIPIDIYCFKKGLELVFKERFNVIDKEDRELKELIPEYYK